MAPDEAAAPPPAVPLPAAGRHVIADTTCLRCGRPAPGTLRVAIWEEEEKGRLGARPVSLCAACHAAFLAGAFGRVEVARWYHAAKDYAPHGWIGRVDRDLLLDGVCLGCGVILPSPAAADPPPPDARCPACGTVNRWRARAGRWMTAERVAAAPAP
jgi:hypothetical protein